MLPFLVPFLLGLSLLIPCARLAWILIIRKRVGQEYALEGRVQLGDFMVDLWLFGLGSIFGFRGQIFLVLLRRQRPIILITTSDLKRLCPTCFKIAGPFKIGPNIASNMPFLASSCRLVIAPEPAWRPVGQRADPSMQLLP